MSQLKFFESVDVMKCKLVRESTVNYSPVTTIDSAIEIFKALGLADSPDEVFAMICFDASQRVVGLHEVAHGTITGCNIRPADVYKRALANNAYRIIVAHNHPSGSLNPSPEDIKCTETLVAAGKLLDIKLIDHIIISEDGSFSFLENGLLK